MVTHTDGRVVGGAAGGRAGWRLSARVMPLVPFSFSNGVDGEGSEGPPTCRGTSLSPASRANLIGSWKVGQTLTFQSSCCRLFCDLKTPVTCCSFHTVSGRSQCCRGYLTCNSRSPLLDLLYCRRQGVQRQTTGLREPTRCDTNKTKKTEH